MNNFDKGAVNCDVFIYSILSISILTITLMTEYILLCLVRKIESPRKFAIITLFVIKWAIKR